MGEPPLQTIFFGSTGTGKSHMVSNDVLEEIGIEDKEKDVVRAVFHPEYSYGDFIGKVMPITNSKGSIEYNYYAGHFLKAVGKAYSKIIEDNVSGREVALIIDEINRGNSSSIFGNAFQLLDRGKNGWSENSIDISDLEFGKLMEISGIKRTTENDGTPIFKYGGSRYPSDEVNKLLRKKGIKIAKNKMSIPDNLSILATMNTSDSSVFYMDNAFKRRWNWQYVTTKSNTPRREGIAFEERSEWEDFVDSLNEIIRNNHARIRDVESYLIGYWFIDKQKISYYDIQNKIMFYLWNSVFSKSKEPVAELLDVGTEEIVTFGEFSDKVEVFVKKVKEHQ